MSTLVAVQVPVEDSQDLQALIDGLGSDAEITTIRPFDGTAVAQVVVPILTVGFPFYRSWLRARVDQRRAVKVIKDGIEYNGLNDRQLDRVLGESERDAT